MRNYQFRYIPLSDSLMFTWKKKLSGISFFFLFVYLFIFFFFFFFFIIIIIIIIIIINRKPNFLWQFLRLLKYKVVA